MPPRLLALELVVDDLDLALELLVDGVGLEVIGRSRHPVLDADVATLDLGTVVLTILHPTATGTGEPVHPTASNLTQLVLATDGPVAAVVDRLAEQGAGIVVDSPTMAHLSSQTIAAVLGVAPTLLLTELADDDVAEP